VIAFAKPKDEKRREEERWQIGLQNDHRHREKNRSIQIFLGGDRF
jgi:hypothetical protein